MNNTLKKNRYALIRNLSTFMVLFGIVFCVYTPSQAASRAFSTLEEGLISTKAKPMPKVPSLRQSRRSMHVGIELKPTKLHGTYRRGVSSKPIGVPNIRVQNGIGRTYFSKKVGGCIDPNISSLIIQKMQNEISTMKAHQRNLYKKIAELENKKNPEGSSLETETKPISVPIVILPHGKKFPIPSHATAGSAGLDVIAAIDHPITIKPDEVVFIPAGFCLQLPKGYFAYITSRSGIARKFKVAPFISSIIDADYTGEILTGLYNQGVEDYIVEPGTRISQMVILRFFNVDWKPTHSLLSTGRGKGGFGSTGR